jgi:soluble lytic murein transglycosylase-like protein
MTEKFSRKGARAQREDAGRPTAGARLSNEPRGFFAPLRLCVSSLFRRSHARRLNVAALALLFVLSVPAVAFADRLLLIDGTAIEVDEAWDDAEGVWYRRGGMTNFVARARVKTIERKGLEKDAKEAAKSRQVAQLSDAGDAANETAKTAQVVVAPARPLWIYLVGGARFEVDEANESAEGVWYKRGNLSIFLERARIERIERESDELKAETEETATTERAVRRERRWTTGRPQLDALIRQNGARYGVDPYLIFCVMEQESHFNAGAVSPVGARGLMQLMPGTAARFGVRSIHDPAQNIAGGTRFLKLLLGRFNGRVELVLASYNAGEGAVMKYGNRVPPYRETRNYVRRISGRYGRAAHAVSERTTTVSSKTTAAGSGSSRTTAVGSGSNRTTAVVVAAAGN